MFWVNEYEFLDGSSSEGYKMFHSPGYQETTIKSLVLIPSVNTYQLLKTRTEIYKFDTILVLDKFFYCFGVF